MPYLVWDRGVRDPLSLLLRDITIGRSAKCDVELLNETISRRHAAIKRCEDGVISLTDLDSANGTTVNGNKVRGPVMLCDGDEIKFAGAFTATYRKKLSPDEIEQIFNHRLDTFVGDRAAS